MNKRIISVFVAFCVMISLQTSFSPQALAEEPVSGTCGAEGNKDNVTWSLDVASGTLTISGTGEMNTITAPEWENRRDEIKAVVFEHGVTNVGSSFEGCSNLTSISISDTVTKLGNSVFADCTSLTSVVIPENVKEIGGYCFWDCKNLSSVTLPASMSFIGDSAFRDCTSLRNLILPEGLTKIPEKTFCGCSSLQSINVPDTVTMIGAWAFGHCSALKSIALPNGLTKIEEYAFSGSGLTGTVTLPAALTTMEAGAFSRCSSLQSFALAEGNASFLNIDGIIYAAGNNQPVELSAYPCGRTAKDYEFPQSVTGFDVYTMCGCVNLEKVTIPAATHELYYNGTGSSIGPFFESCPRLTSISVDAQNSAYCSEDGVLYSKDKKSLLRYPSIKPGSNFTIPQAVTTIEMAAFDGAVLLEKVDIPNSVTNIMGNAFQDCSSLKKLTIPSSVQRMFLAFGGCKSLTSAGPVGGGYAIEYPWTDKILDYAFGNATELKSVTLPATITEIGDSAFYNCSALTGISIPSSVTKIGNDAFEKCSSLQRITLPDSVTSLGSQAFLECSALTHVDLSKSLTSIESSAFSTCPSLERITIPAGVTTICSGAFSECPQLKSVVIYAGVTDIRDRAFADDNPALTFYGQEGSYANTYATRVNICFKPLGAYIDAELGGVKISAGQISQSATGASAEISISCMSSVDETVDVIVAAYNDSGRMLACKTEKIPISAKTITVDFGNISGCTKVKAFLLDGLCPLREAKDLSS